MRPYAEKINGIIAKPFIPFEGEWWRIYHTT
jgi:hypothetical protein